MKILKKVDRSLQKVAFTRRMDLRFDPTAELVGLDIYASKMKTSGEHEGGHMFNLNPGEWGTQGYKKNL